MLIRAAEALRLPLITAVCDIAEHGQALDAPAVEYTRLLARGASPMRPPLFLLGATGALDTAPLYRQVGTPEIGCYVLEDAAIAPTGIAVRQDTAFASHAFLHAPPHVSAVIDRLNATTLPQRHIPGPLAIIYGPGHETWGHWLVDFLPRLAVLDRSGWDIGALRFAVPWDLQPFARELLHAAGIAEGQFVVYKYWEEVLTTDRLLMPTGLRAQDRLSPFFAEATQFWIGRVLARVRLPRSPGLRRVFVRRAEGSRRLENPLEIDALAKRRGLAAVRPELMTLAEQIALFRDTRLVVGEYGSALHNTVFSAAGAVACGLRGTSAHPGFVQSGLATALDQHAAYVLGDTTGQEVVQHITIAPDAFNIAMDILDTM